MRIGSKKKRRAWLAALSCASAASLACCSLFVDTDGLNDGADASTTTADASSFDASFDASTDGGSPADATINDATSPAIFSCDGGHVVCDDFEELTFEPPWTGDFTTGSGMLSRASDASVSPTHSFHSLAGALASGSAAPLYKTLSTPSTTLHCELDALVKSGSPQILELNFQSSAPDIAYYYVAFNIGADTYITTADVFPDAGGNYAGGSSSNPVPLNTWTHVVLEFGPDGSGGTQVTAIAGDGGPNVKPSHAPVGSTLTDITLSDDYTLDAFELFADNVVCDVTP